MEAELKCNRLTCRRPVTNKAVVTTCSHIFCIDCANELFNLSRLCPACETSLTEPDDVVVCSLHPTNDYKTSVLSGLGPSIILEICSRAISFWQYQIHQENSFQQAVIRNVNDKNAQLQKQLENVVREANGEITLLNSKTAELERDLELERKKVRELQETSRERDKEYQKLKVQHDKIKRRALLGPNNGYDKANILNPQRDHRQEDQLGTPRGTLGGNSSIDFASVAGNMDANRLQRTPIVSRNGGIAFGQIATNWNQYENNAQGIPPPGQIRGTSHRQQFPVPPPDRSYRSSGYASDRSESANEVENILLNQPQGRGSAHSSGWSTSVSRDYIPRPTQRVFAPQVKKRASGGFRPAGAPR